MLTGNSRLESRVRRRDALGWLALLSLALHLALALTLLAAPSSQMLPATAEPLAVDFIAEAGPSSSVPELPALAEASVVPPALATPGPPAVVPPETPALAPEAPVSPVQPAETSPLPPPAQPAEVTPQAPAAPPEVPSAAPDQVAEIPLPAPRPQPVPPPRSLTPRPLLPRPPPSRPAVRPQPPGVPASPAGPPAVAAQREAAAARSAATTAAAANNGAAWMGRLKQWWDQHSVYPREASRANDGGSVRVRIGIAADGQVTSIQVVQGSGSSVLDAAALAVFRGARLPPFPPGTPAQPADVVVTLHYRPADGDR